MNILYPEVFLLCNSCGALSYTGVLCNRQCPDKLLLGELTSNNWHIGVKIFIVILIIGIATICTIVKLMFTIWLHKMEKKMNDYLHSLYKMGSSDRAKLQVRLLLAYIGIIIAK